MVDCNEIIETANEVVNNGTSEWIDLFKIQKTLDDLEKVFFENGIKEEVLSPVATVTPLIDAY